MSWPLAVSNGVLVAVVLCVGGFSDWTTASDGARFALCAALGGAALVAAVLRHAGRLRLAAAVPLAIVLAALTAYVWSCGLGIHSAAVFGYLPAILFAALALGPFAGGGVALFCVGTLAALFWSEQTGVLPGLAVYAAATTHLNFFLGTLASVVATLGIAAAFRTYGGEQVLRVAQERARREAACAETAALHAELHRERSAGAARVRSLERDAAAARRELAAALLELEALASEPLNRLRRHSLRLREVDLSALAQSAAQALREAHPAVAARFEIATHLRAFGDATLLGAALEAAIADAARLACDSSRPLVEVGMEDTRHGRALYVRASGGGSATPIAAVRQIVRRHGGEAWAEGAAHYFTLPPASWHDGSGHAHG